MRGLVELSVLSVLLEKLLPAQPWRGMIHSFLANQQLQQGRFGGFLKISGCITALTTCMTCVCRDFGNLPGERQCLIDGTGAMGSKRPGSGICHPRFGLSLMHVLPVFGDRL